MAEKVKFQPQTFNINSINNGNRYGLEGIQPEAVNAPIEAAAYAQSLATQQPNINDIDGQGNPNVSIEEINGTPRFKFSNLKGKDGKDLSKEVKELQKTQEENKKSIINLYAITSPLYVQKTIEQSYSSRITANGENIFNEQFTPILKVEGSTVKSKNLLPVPKNASQTINGVTFTNNGDGTFTLNGTATAETIYSVGGLGTTTMPIPAGTYTLSGGISSSIWLQGKIAEAGFDSITWDDYGKGGTYATTEHHYFRYNIRVTNGTVCKNVIVKPMLELGATKTEYQPYFTGLKNASFKGIKSTGRNLFDAEYNSKNYISNGKTNVVLQNGKTYTISCIVNEVSTSTWLCAVAEDEKVAFPAILKSRLIFYNKGKTSTTFTIPEDGKVYKLGLCYSGAPSTNQWAGFFNGSYCRDIMVALGDNSEYEPYTEDTLELPEAIDCGLGTTIDFENQKIVEKGVTIVLTGSEAWYVGDGYNESGKYYSVIWSFLLSSNENRANGIATDGLIKRGIYADGLWWLGVTGRAIYILAAERYFGFTQFADPNNPTAEERATLLAEWKAYLAQRYADGNPVTIRYVSSTVQAETPFTDAQKAAGNTYKVWNNGTENIGQGETDNSVYGALNKIEQTYFAPLGEETYE